MPNFDYPVLQEDVDTYDLPEIACALGEVYFIRKEADDEQKLLREEFFQAVTASFEGQDLAQKTVEVPKDIATLDDAEAHARQYYPGWRVVETVVGEPFKVLIEEDPAFKQFVHVVELEPWEISAPTKKDPNRQKTVYGYVITKTIRSGSTLVDDERMKAVNPDLYNRITKLPEWWDTLSAFGVQGDPAKVFAALSEYRVMRDDLDEDEYDEIKPYVYEGPKTVALNVRYADKDESNGE